MTVGTFTVSHTLLRHRRSSGLLFGLFLLLKKQVLNLMLPVVKR